MAGVDKAWGKWVRQHRDALRLSGRALATLAKCDPGYICRMERGEVPSREVVERIGRALHNPDEALVLAGFIPDGVQRLRVLRLAEADLTPLAPELRELIATLKSMAPVRQRRIAATVRSLVEGLSGEASLRKRI